MAIFWLAIVAVLYSQGLIITDINKINEITLNNPFNMGVIFVLLSTVRVLFFIPQTIFIIIGSMLFGPYVGFILSVLSLSISQSILYAVGRYFQNQLLGVKFLEKNMKTIAIIVMSDAPMIFLYGFLGTGIQGSFFFKTLAIVAIILVSYYTFVIWNKINCNSQREEKHSSLA